MVHLHTRSWYSFQAGASSPTSLVEAAARDGQTALALTDVNQVASAVDFAVACKASGIKPIYSAEVTVEGFPLVLLAADRDGYANLCDILTVAHRQEKPCITFEEMEPHTEGLFCLTGDRYGKLATCWRKGEYEAAHRHLSRLNWYFHGRLFVELAHHRRRGDAAMLRGLAKLAKHFELPCVATNAVRHSTPEEYACFDALTCAGLGISINEPSPLRPVNDQAYLKTVAEMRDLGFRSSLLANSDAIARECNVDLLRDEVEPPEALIPAGLTAPKYLRKLCFDAFVTRYPRGHVHRAQANATLKREVKVITQLGLEEFFLVVREVMQYARSRGIRCSGRGSAANSIVAYLLGITGVDPIEHGLLFERFLHAGRRGMPDIDCDFETHRRLEVLDWMEKRFTNSHTAITANVVTYRLKNSLEDMMKVLGYPLTKVNEVSDALPRGYASEVRHYYPTLATILGESPLLETLVNVVETMDGCPRHLSQHSGGMILSRIPLRYCSPILTSDNGVRQIVFNKDDIERLGLIKFDVLGLRMLSVVTEALELQREDAGSAPDVDNLPFDDQATYDLICSGKTMSIFQIESGGQWNLISKSQPRVFNDLIAQVALFRPGPLQSHMVHPFIGRRRGMQKVSYPHPSLENCLRGTYGIILYQEQILEVAHDFSGLNLSEADEFRRLMSKFRSPDEMESMRAKFVNGAIAKHNVRPELADYVFNIVAKFVGYGFCKSHAAEFARTVYITAYLKAHYPAAFMAGALEHKPGFYPVNTMLQEARHCGAQVLPPDIRYSGVRYRLENGAIRVPFTQIDNVSVDSAAAITLERWDDPFQSIEDTYRRVRLKRPVWDLLAQAGVFDCFNDNRREVLWEIGTLASTLGQSGQTQLAFDEDAFIKDSLPELEALNLEEILEWDFETQHLTTGPHLMAMHRDELDKLGCTPIQQLMNAPGRTKVRTAGLVISRQRPPTAKGMGFYIIEDETWRMPCAITPAVYDRLWDVLRSPGLIIDGVLEGSGKGQVGMYRSLLVQRVWSLSNVIGEHEGGYVSFPGEMAR